MGRLRGYTKTRANAHSYTLEVDALELLQLGQAPVGGGKHEAAERVGH